MEMLKNKEAIPTIDLHMMVDGNHDGDKATRRSWSSILAFMNIAPIDIDYLLQVARRRTLESKDFEV
jgi:hypothetical protein